MQANVKLLAELAASGLTGGTLWMIYAAIWKHAPLKFPRSLDDWWGWVRGSNQEIASQHGPNGSNIPVNPIMAGSNPAKEGK